MPIYVVRTKLIKPYVILSNKGWVDAEFISILNKTLNLKFMMNNVSFYLLFIAMILFITEMSAQKEGIEVSDLSVLKANADSLPIREKRIAELENELGRKEAEIRNLNKEKSQSESRAESAKRSLDSLTQELEKQIKINNKLEKEAKQNREDASKLKPLQDSIKSLKKQLREMDDLKNDNSRLSDEIEKNKTEFTKLNNEFQNINNSKSQLEKQLEDQNKQILQLNEELKKRDSTIGQLSEMVGKLKISILERVRSIVGAYPSSKYEPSLVNELKQQMQLVVQYANSGPEQQEAQILLKQLETYEILAKVIMDAKDALAKDYNETVINNIKSRLNSSQLNNPALNAEKQRLLTILSGYLKFYQETYNFFYSTKGFSTNNMLKTATDYLKDEHDKLLDYPFLLEKVQYVKDHPGETDPLHRMPLRKID